MAVSVVQETDGGSSSAVSSYNTKALSTTAGNVLMVIVNCTTATGTSGPDINSLTDAAGNKWVRCFYRYNATLKSGHEVWTTSGPTAALSSGALSLTFAISTTVTYQFYEISGANTAAPIDTFRSNTGGPGVSITTGAALAPSAAGQLCFGVFSGLIGTPSSPAFTSGAATTVYPASGETHVSGGALLAATLVVAGSTAQTFTLTVSNSNRWTSSVFFIRAASSIVTLYTGGTISDGTLDGSGSQAVTLPLTTRAGDCVVLQYALAQDGTTKVTPSGGGLTWVQALFDDHSDPSAGVWVGYNAGAGNTSITLTYNGSDDGSFALSMYAGAATASSPIGSTDDQTTASGLTITSNSVSYSAGSALTTSVSFLALSGGNTATPSWSNGSVDFPVGNTDDGGNLRCLIADEIGVASAGSTTVSYTLPNDDPVSLLTVEIKAATGIAATGTMAASVVLAASAVADVPATGHVLGSATLAGSGLVDLPATGSIVSSAVLAGSGVVKVSASGSMLASAVMSGTGAVKYTGSGSIVGTARLSATASVLAPDVVLLAGQYQRTFIADTYTRGVSAVTYQRSVAGGQ